MVDEGSRSESSTSSDSSSSHESHGSRSPSPTFNNINQDTNNIDMKNGTDADENSLQQKADSNIDDLSDVDFDEDQKDSIDKQDSKDLSDVSEDELGSPSKKKQKDSKSDLETNDLRLKLEELKNTSSNNKINDKISTSLNDEDALDFEAEEGECSDVKDADISQNENTDKKIELSEPEEGEELEEGEVTDEEERRPEENEPKPVCRFYTRGQCTWGVSCRFLHPGVTDKGNYTMFDMVRPVSAQPSYGHPPFHEGFRELRPPIPHVAPHHHASYPVPARPAVASADSESAWERGLRFAKEMMRKANKRKEQDIDFEDKKMNLSLSQDELEKDNYYTKDKSSPEVHSYERQASYNPPAHSARIANTNYEEDPYGRVPRYRYRELPPHRMPHYEDDLKRRPKPTREVIVQRADEWNDPWMRGKSPLRSKRKSYSSNSSYSSSSSSQSGSSSGSSRSPSPVKNRRYTRQKSDSEQSGPSKKYLRNRSPARRRYSPVRKINSPKRYDSRITPPKRSEKGPSPKRKRLTSPVNRKQLIPSKKRPGSSSDTSDSSESESDSSDSSSSDSSTSSVSKNVRARDVVLTERKTATKKVEMTKKRLSSDNEAKGTSNSGVGKKSNRREELLKQLKAVEDAIARKRSKIN